MIETEIENLFTEVIQERGVSEKLTGISKDDIYNWRKGRGRKPNLGDMLNTLYQLNLIKISKK